MVHVQKLVDVQIFIHVIMILKLDVMMDRVRELLVVLMKTLLIIIQGITCMRHLSIFIVRPR